MTGPVPAGPAPLNCPFCGQAPTRWDAQGGAAAPVVNYRCPDLTCPAGAAYRPVWAWNRRSVPLSDEGLARALLERYPTWGAEEGDPLSYCRHEARWLLSRAYLSTPPSGRDERSTIPECPTAFVVPDQEPDEDGLVVVHFSEGCRAYVPPEFAQWVMAARYAALRAALSPPSRGQRQAFEMAAAVVEEQALFAYSYDRDLWAETAAKIRALGEGKEPA